MSVRKRRDEDVWGRGGVWERERRRKRREGKS